MCTRSGEVSKPSRLLQSLTPTQADVNAQLSSLTPSDGNDLPGSHLEALYQGTTGEGLSITSPFVYSIPASPVGWRTNALHAIVLISDSPFHDPLIDYPYPGHTFEQTIEAMNSNAVEMIGLSVGSGYGINDMQTIAAGTGGLPFPTVYFDPGLVLEGLGALMSQY